MKTENTMEPGQTYVSFGTLSRGEIEGLISRWESLEKGNVAVMVVRPEHDYYVFRDRTGGDAVGYEFINAFLATILTPDGERK